MKVDAVQGRGHYAAVPPSPIVQRLNWVRHNIVQARAQGASQVSFVLQDQDLDQELLRRIKTQFGEDNVRVEKSKTMKVDVKL